MKSAVLAAMSRVAIAKAAKVARALEFFER